MLNEYVCNYTKLVKVSLYRIFESRITRNENRRNNFKNINYTLLIIFEIMMAVFISCNS